MMALLIRRSLQAIPTFVVVSFIMFMLLSLGPNPLDQLKENPNITQADITRLSHQFGWDKPLMTQYGIWASKFAHGDMGTSMMTMRPARDMIFDRLPLTLMLSGMSLLVSLMIAIPIGAFTAVRKYSNADYAATFLTFIMMATPSFFLALLMQLGALKLQDFAGGAHIFYVAGRPDHLWHPIQVFQHMTLPIMALSMLQIAGWSRYQRSEMLGVLESDFVKSAIAKGIPARRVFIAHAMRNTMLPIITIVAMDVAMLFGGAVITETVFGLPGMGSLLLMEVNARDSVVVLDIVMIGTLLVLVCNTVADVLYGVLDPRVRVQ